MSDTLCDLTMGREDDDMLVKRNIRSRVSIDPRQKV